MLVNVLVPIAIVIVIRHVIKVYALVHVLVCVEVLQPVLITRSVEVVAARVKVHVERLLVVTGVDLLHLLVVVVIVRIHIALTTALIL